MNRKALTIKYFIKKSDESHNGSYLPIFIRIIYNRKKAEMFTGENISSKEWDSVNQRPLHDTDLELSLGKMRTFLLEQKRKYEVLRQSVSARTLKEKLLRFLNNDEEDCPELLQYFQDYISRISGLKNDYARSTIKNYRKTYNHLKQFLVSARRENLLLQNFDYSLILELDDYLNTLPGKEEKGLSRNYINDLHKRIRIVINYAIDNGAIALSPYKRFKRRQVPTTRDFLSDEEINKLRLMDLKNEKTLDKVRDLFIFSVYTGLRFSDVHTLKPEHVLEYNGEWWINKTIEKTKKQKSTPLLEPALKVLEKYKQSSEITGHLLPGISNQKMNIYLKGLASRVGITKNLSSHVARHTFATMVCLSKGVPVEVVKEWLGHANIRETMIYARIVPEYSSEHAKRVNVALK